MKSKFSSKIVASILSITTLISSVVTGLVPVTVWAATPKGNIKAIVYESVFFTADTVNGEDGSGDGVYQYSSGYKFEWDNRFQNANGGKPNAASGDVAFGVSFNNGQSGTDLTGDPLTVVGVYYMNYNAWKQYTMDVSPYEDTGMVTLKIKIENEAFRNNAYAFLLDEAKASGINAVKIKPEYCKDIGNGWEQVNIPVKDFVKGDNDSIAYTGGVSALDASKISGGGIGFTNGSELTDAATVWLDDYYICNVDPVTNLQASDISDSSVTINWDKNDSASGYEVYKKSADGEFILTETIASNATTQYADTAVAAGEEYTYAVRAVDATGAVSADTTVDVKIPYVGAPANLAAKSYFGNELKVELSWDAAAFPATGVSYTVYRKSTGDFEKLAEDITDTTYTDEAPSVENNAEYTYKVCATTDNLNYSDATNEVTITAAAISQPQEVNVHLNYVVEAGSSVDLKWTKPSLPADLTEETYTVYRKDGNSDFEAVATELTEMKYSDADVKNGGEYTYYIVAIKGEYSSAESEHKGVMIEYVGKPQNLTVTASSANKSAELKWSAVENATKYYVYRNGEKLSDEPTATSYIDNDLEYSKIYRYEVKAVGELNGQLLESAVSDSAVAILTNPMIDAKSIVSVSEGENGFTVEAIGSATVEEDTENLIDGENSYKVTLSQESGIKFVKDIDFEDYYYGGGLISMCIDADELSDLKLGLTSSTTVSVELADYVTDKTNGWVYVEVPVSDFPADFNYAGVKYISVYTDSSAEKVINVDNVSYAKYLAPVIDKLLLEDGSEVKGAITSDDKVKKLILTFKSAVEGVAELDASTVTPETVIMKEGVNSVVISPVYTDKGLEIFIPDGLKPNKTKYKITLAGVKSKAGGVVVADKEFSTGSVSYAAMSKSRILNNSDLLDILFLDSYYDMDTKNPYPSTGQGLTNKGPSDGTYMAYTYNEYYSGNGVRATNYNANNVPKGPLTVVGMTHRTLDGTVWNQANAVDLSKYVNTAVVSVDVCIQDKTFIENAYVYLDNSLSGYENIHAVKIGDRYTAADAGTWKRIYIPVSAFVNGDENSMAYTGGPAKFNPANLIGGGIAFGNTAELTAHTTVMYDNFWVEYVAAPRNFEIKELTRNSVTLKWDMGLGGADRYQITRTDVDGNTVVIAVVDSSAKEYTDYSITKLGEYKYTISAFNDIGAKSVESNVAAADVREVEPPVDFTAESSFGTELKVELSWNAPKSGADMYYVYRSKGNSYECITPDGITDTSYVDVEITNNKEYTYYVTSVKNGEESSPSYKYKMVACYIASPANVTASANVSSKEITISWDAVANADKYYIYIDGVKIETASASYTHTNVEYSYSHNYAVSAVKGDFESLKSETILDIIKNPAIEATPKATIYEDAVATGYTAKSVGGASSSLADYTSATGELSYQINFKTGTQQLNGIAFSNGSTYENLRYSGGLISFYVYAASKDMLKDVKLGLECPVTVRNTAYTARTSVYVADYIDGRYGDWVYVEIPMADFSEKGLYVGSGVQTAQKINMDFDKINALSIYIEEAQMMVNKNILIDELQIFKYTAPTITGVMLEDNTTISPDGTISTNTDKLYVTFNEAMKADTFTDGVVTLKSGDTIVPVSVKYESGKAIIDIIGALSPSTAYELVIVGARAATNGVVNNSAIPFAFRTDADEYVDSGLSTEANVTVTAPAEVKSGNIVSANLTIDDVAATASVKKGKFVISYSKNHLTVSDSNVVLSQALELAGAKVTTLDAGEITIEFDVNDAAIILGTDIATIDFSSMGVGTASIKVSGSLTDYQDSEAAITCSDASIAVKAGSTGAPMGGGGGGGAASSPSHGAADPSVITGGGREDIPANEEASDDTNDVVETSLTDANEVSWATEAITYLYANGYISGYEDNTFRPNNSVTREEFVAMLINAVKTSTADAEASFNDVTKNDWFYSVVAAAERDGIVKGDDKGNFGVGDNITRQDMCAMLERAIEKYNLNIKANYSPQRFADFDSIADYAQNAVVMLQSAGIVNGVGDNKFAPEDTVTRAMAAKVIYEIVQIIIAG